MTKSRVLLVDDEPGIRLALRKWFERQGWEVDEAGDGASAFACLDQVNTGYALVICDVHLPGVSGFDIAARVENDWPDLLTRFVFSTGDDMHFGGDHVALRARTQTLLKPYDFSVLPSLVSQVAGSSALS